MAAAPIATIPQGLLGLLQLKELGANPRELVPVVAPTMDLTPFYLERLMQSEIGLFNGAAPQTIGIASAAHGNQQFSAVAVGSTSSVPVNETWYCTHAGCEIDASSPGGGNTVVAGDTIIAQLAWAIPQGIGTFGFSPVTRDTITARARSWKPDPMVRPIWLPPGAQFWLVVYDILVAAGAYKFNLTMRAARIPI